MSMLWLSQSTLSRCPQWSAPRMRHCHQRPHSILAMPKTQSRVNTFRCTLAAYSCANAGAHRGCCCVEREEHGVEDQRPGHGGRQGQGRHHHALRQGLADLQGRTHKWEEQGCSRRG